jgi:hypothetical protein
MHSCCCRAPAAAVPERGSAAAAACAARATPGFAGHGASCCAWLIPCNMTADPSCVSELLQEQGGMPPCDTAMQMSTQCTVHLKPSNCSMLAQSQRTIGHTSGWTRPQPSARAAPASTPLQPSCVWRTHPSPPPANLPARHGHSGRTQLEQIRETTLTTVCTPNRPAVLRRCPWWRHRGG